MRRHMLLATAAGSIYLFNGQSQNRYMNFDNLMRKNVAECYISDEKRKKLQGMNTNVYVWGEGQQVDIQQDYSNYSPKNISPFRGKDKPNIIDVAFGWYHEAYID